MAGKHSKQFEETIARLRHGAIICSIGIVLNLIGIYSTYRFDAPITMDAIGTVFTGVFGGYLPGIVTGFITNVMCSIQDYKNMSYGFLNMIVAVIANILVKKGFFEKFWKVVATIPVFGVITGILHYVISDLIGEHDGKFVDLILWDLLDKGITIIFVYILFCILPEEFRIKERLDAQSGIHKVKSRLISIRGKILIMLTMFCVLIATTITMISYMQYRDQVIQDHIKLGKGAIQLVREKLDPDRVDDFIEHGYTAVGYYSVENYLYDLRNNLPDAQYIYVYKMQLTGIFVVFDLDTDEWAADPPGDFIEYEDVLAENKNKFVSGKEVEPTISNDKYGFLLSVYEPLYNRKGQVECYICIDFSMNVLNRYIRSFIISIVTMFIGFFMFIFAVFIKLMELNIVMPINEMAYCASKFGYGSEAERQDNVERINRLDIRTGDEVENLYIIFRKTVEDSTYYMSNLRRAQNQVMTMAEQVSQISVTAYTDSLTGVKNKAAYQKKRQELECEINDGTAEFAIVMIDLNRLKHINDTYGHEKGDFYIKGACKIICDIFKHSPVYRFGGDEFVVVLTGESYKRRNELVDNINNVFQETGVREDAEPWERFWAAAGMSEYDGKAGDRVDNVFKRADANMYDYKVKMKAQRTD